MEAGYTHSRLFNFVFRALVLWCFGTLALWYCKLQQKRIFDSIDATTIYKERAKNEKEGDVRHYQKHQHIFLTSSKLKLNLKIEE